MFTSVRPTATSAAMIAAVGLAFVPGAAQAATQYDYTVSGAATLDNLRVKGTIALNGSVRASIADSGTVTGDVTLKPTTGDLGEFGFIPIEAEVEFESAGPAVGQLSGNTLTVTTMQTIKLKKATVFGFLNIVHGNECRTKQPSKVTLTSNAFSPASGGTLSGDFAISELQDCGFLTWDLNGAISGPDNSAKVTLSR